jgi:tetrahydromethanopterin S-methyltransferase subunit G
MSIISVPQQINSNSKNIEYIDLEAHAVLSKHRYDHLEYRITEIEKDVELLKAQSRSAKKMVIGGVMSIVTGIMITVLSIVLNYSMR